MSGLGGFFHNGMKRVGIDSGPRADGTRAMEAKRQAGATAMQAVVRGHLGRNRATAESKSQVEAKRQSAATTMQAVVRGHLGRNRATAESKSQAEEKRESGAVKFQAAFRGHQARNATVATHYQRLVNQREGNALKRAADVVSPAEVRENRVKLAADHYTQKANSWSMTARDYMPAIFNKKQVWNIPIIGRVAFSAFTTEGKEDYARGKEMAEGHKGINSVIDHYADRAKTLATHGNSSENRALETKVATRAAAITATIVPGAQGAAPIINAAGKALEAGFHLDAANKRMESSTAYEKRSRMVGNKQLKTPLGKALGRSTAAVLAARGEFQADQAEVSKKGVRSALVSGTVGAVAAGIGTGDILAHTIKQTNAADFVHQASVDTPSPMLSRAAASAELVINHAHTPLNIFAKKAVGALSTSALPKTAREQAESNAAPSRSWGEWASSVKRSITGARINDTHINPWYHLQSKQQKKVINEHVFSRHEAHEAAAQNTRNKRHETKMKSVRATEHVQAAGKLANQAFTPLQRAWRAKKAAKIAGRKTLHEADRPTSHVENHAHGHDANKSNIRSTSVNHTKASTTAPAHRPST